jgi:hypothetical protein
MNIPVFSGAHRLAASVPLHFTAPSVPSCLAIATPWLARQPPAPLVLQSTQNTRPNTNILGISSAARLAAPLPLPHHCSPSSLVTQLVERDSGRKLCGHLRPRIIVHRDGNFLDVSGARHASRDPHHGHRSLNSLMASHCNSEGWERQPPAPRVLPWPQNIRNIFGFSSAL